MEITNEQKKLLVEQVRKTQITPVRNPHILICGPSGSGKTTLIRTGEQSIMSLKSDIYEPAVSAATRNKRPNEIDGVDYRFMSQADFGVTDFFETNEYTGNKKLYGTPVSEIERICITFKKRMLLDVDVNGALKFQRFFGADIFSVFLKTTDPVLAQRLRSRGESEDSINGRLKAAYKERRLVETEEFKPNLVLPYDSMEASEAVNLILTEAHQYILQFA